MNQHGNTRQIEVEVFPGNPDLRLTLASSQQFADAMNEPRGVFAGQTFGGFVQAALRLGVTDDTPLASIEFGVSRHGNGRLTIDRDADPLGIELREGRR